ncbi:hypothetical protein [Sinomicrobium sp. M5D2P9]
MKAVVIIVCLFLVTARISGQEKFPEMIQLEYNINKSDEGVNIYETRIGGSKVFSAGSFRIGVAADIRKFDMDYTYTSPATDEMHFTEVYTLKPEVFVSYLLDEVWSFTAYVQPEIASDFHGDWTGEGFNLGYGAYFTRLWKQPGGVVSSLVIGGEYSTAFGKLRFVPILNYKRRINEHWAYAVGYPYTYLSWKINPKHTVRPVLDLDSFYAGVNAVTGYFAQAEEQLYKLSYLNLNGRINYEYYFNRGWNLVAGFGYTIYNELDLYRDDTRTHTYDMVSSLYISLGIKYKF